MSSEPVSVGEAIRGAAERLGATSDTPRLDAELLMAHALGISRSDMLLRAMRDPAPDGFEALVARRQGHEPVAYITGSAEFYGLDLQVSPAVLIPRAERLGLTLALEPHMDYRSTELLQVVEAIGSPALRLVFDFSDPLSVNEDPLDAARHVAPYVAAVHIRDMRVQALTEIATGAFFHAPLGEGNVPLLEMLQVINDSASSASSLPCCLKVVTRPEHDVEHWLEASIEWLRTRSSADWF